MKKSQILKRILETLPLISLITLSVLLFSARTNFGLGLGDWFFRILTYSITIIYSGYFLVREKGHNLIRILLPLLAFIFAIYIFFLMSFGRGPEYGWDGHVLESSTIDNRNAVLPNFGDSQTKLLKESRFKGGDLIFQISKSSQSKAIQLATNSKYSHMGIIYEIDGEFFVYEAIQPVQITPIKEWIKRGENGHFVVKRLRNADKVLTDEVLAQMKDYGQQFIGKPYDIHFEWSDEKMYCSELVWKIYKNAANIEIGKLQKLSEFDLTHKIVKDKMKERYGSEIPLDEKVISPAAMFDSELLILVQQN